MSVIVNLICNSFILMEGNWKNLKAISLPNHSLDLRFLPVIVFVLIVWHFRIT